MSESLKAQRERLALEFIADTAGEGSRAAFEDACEQLRELQRAAMEAVVAHIGGITFHAGEPGKEFLRGWTVSGEDCGVWAEGKLSIDALLDEEKP